MSTDIVKRDPGRRRCCCFFFFFGCCSFCCFSLLLAALRESGGNRGGQWGEPQGVPPPVKTPLQKDCNFNSQKEIFKLLEFEKAEKYDSRGRFAFASELCVIF